MPEIKNLGFQKAKKNRIFQDVVDQIQEAILNNELKPGDMLPAERDLRETFNVSRGTLREALRVLEQKGLIEIRLGTGGGSIVKNTGMEQLNETLALLIRSGELSVFDLGEFRAGIEEKVAFLAANRADENQIEILDKLLQEAGRLAETGISAWDDFLEKDQEIHKKVAEFSGNTLYRFVSSVIQDNIRRYYDRFLDVTQERMDRNYQDLQELTLAIRNKDENRAARTAERHVYAFNSWMREKEAVKTGQAVPPAETPDQQKPH